MNLTHEWRDLIYEAGLWNNLGIKSVLATIVAVEGSSYRRPGTRMLINELGQMKGALSGGCVEKEVERQAESVFQNSIPKMMTYDGRFRLGCEGIIHVLIEPIQLTDILLKDIQECLDQRQNFDVHVQYRLDCDDPNKRASMGTIVYCNSNEHGLRPDVSKEPDKSSALFTQSFPPIFQLFIFGAEYDAVQLSQCAAHVGWDVHIIASPGDEKSLSYFKGAKSLKAYGPEDIDISVIDGYSAVVLMTHSLSKDSQHLLALKEVQPAYFGLLGPAHRRERIFDELFNLYPTLQFNFIDQIRGPAGLDIGAENAAEVAISIISEILSVTRDVQPQPLHTKSGKIHE